MDVNHALNLMLMVFNLFSFWKGQNVTWMSYLKVKHTRAKTKILFA